MAGERAPTRADAAYAAIRRDILRGRFVPGAKLAMADLQARYDVSSGVLREVLPRLAEQGLATSEPQLGFRVVTVSVPQLTALTDARVALESMVIRMAAREGDIDYEANVLAAHHALARTPYRTDDGELNEDWIVRHEEFHHVLLSGCGNSYLVDAAERLRSLADVYRYWTADDSDPGTADARDVAAEHAAIAEAAVGRDGERCAALLADHIRLTTETLLRHPDATTGPR